MLLGAFIVQAQGIKGKVINAENGKPANHPTQPDNLENNVTPIITAQNNISHSTQNVVYTQSNAQSELQHIINSVTNLTIAKGIEKIYLHTDKPFYAVGDTLWFKAYLFNAAYLTPSAKSGWLM
ncbi:MAG TPA: hypothetical protein VGC01_08320 [Mucilaginibacter sp.]